MDFDSLLSKYKAKACVVSIDFYENDTYGNIRILEGNKAHYDDMAAIGHPFVPDSPYEAYFPKTEISRTTVSVAHAAAGRSTPMWNFTPWASG